MALVESRIRVPSCSRSYLWERESGDVNIDRVAYYGDEDDKCDCYDDGNECSALLEDPPLLSELREAAGK